MKKYKKVLNNEEYGETYSYIPTRDRSIKHSDCCRICNYSKKKTACSTIAMLCSKHVCEVSIYETCEHFDKKDFYISD